MFMFYNFRGPHLSLTEGKKKRTPAMAAGVADHIFWLLDEVIALLPEKPMGRVRKIGAPPESGQREIQTA